MTKLQFDGVAIGCAGSRLRNAQGPPVTGVPRLTAKSIITRCIRNEFNQNQTLVRDDRKMAQKRSVDSRDVKQTSGGLSSAEAHKISPQFVHLFDLDH